MTQEVEQRILALARRMEEQEATIKELQAQLKQAQEQAGINAYGDEEDMGKVYPNTREGVLQDLLDNFDFEKVADVCQYLGWQIHNEEDGVTVDFLRHDTIEKAHAAWEAFDCGEAKEEYIVHSGPLKLWWCECDEGIFADLSFVAEDWRVEPVER